MPRPLQSAHHAPAASTGESAGAGSGEKQSSRRDRVGVEVREVTASKQGAAPPPRRSVVIPNLNSPLLHRTLEALAAQGAPGADTEVLVVGRDAPGQVPRDGSVRFLETAEPVNPATARNLGVAAAGGRSYYFTDADCAPQPGWLDHLERALEGEDGTGNEGDSETPRVAGGAVLFPMKSSSMDSIPMGSSPMDSGPRDSGLWALADNIASFHELLPDRPAETSSEGPLGSLNLAVNAAGWSRVGPFDEELTTSEDFDWVLRARAAGVPTAFVPEAIVEHAAVRENRAALEGHAAWYGRHFLDFCDRHPALWGTGPTWASRRRLAATAGLKSWWSALQIFRRHPMLRSSWRTLPAVVLFKRAWYREVLASWRRREQGQEQEQRPPGQEQAQKRDEAVPR
ncbi:MAG: glycosyltransferase [Acidobacteriota bacterium]